MSDEFNFVGAAAEHFVAHDLWRRHIGCSLTSQNMEFDLIAFTPQPVRVQVKANSRLLNRLSGEPAYAKRYDRYRFDCSRTRKGYENIDVFAFVALDKLQIMYVPFTGQRYYTFKAEDFDSPMLAEISWFYCMERLYGEIAESD
jgi:hypothetical protein